ncbi:hypothetical protein DSO57_1016577 [Entomophthora muscae]|uniref:Uncharacterized protein n=1 Tax=Entomophthora muscae TaxID=34485 RepID=A0ACC2RW44_9FUNG|nr:hypothetical protein DSO57_1016577 [Entomophthora muscae]
MNPFLNAVIEFNPDALKIAKTLPEELKTRPLYGIPILVKDSIATKDKMNTTAGNPSLLSARPKDDAEVVKRLRRAGAIILGKANLSEMSGARGGQTKNPYDISGPVKGSSSGSAVAVSANLAMVALGTETSGSLNSPAMVNSIFTLKPTYGWVSNEGVVPVARSMDTVGGMSRSADDLKIITDVLTGSQASYLEKKKLKVGLLNYNKGTSNLEFDKFKSLLEKSATVIPSDELSLKDLDYITNAYLKTAVAELSPSLDSYIKHTENTKITLKYLIDQKKGGPAASYDILSFTLKSPANKDKSDIQNGQALARKAIDDLLEKNKVDVLLVFEDPDSNAIFYSAMARYPSMTIPLGLDDKGFPKSIFACTRANSDAVLLSVALAADHNPRFRHKPKFIGY